jgi:hypothetical protein
MQDPYIKSPRMETKATVHGTGFSLGWKSATMSAPSFIYVETFDALLKAERELHHPYVIRTRKHGG